MIQKLFFGGENVSSFVVNSGLFLLRVFTGLALALQHGLPKFPPSERFVEIVANMGFPVPVLFAWAGSVAELFGGLLLAIGFLTRPASFFIIITMFVAAFIRNAGSPFGDKELALLYAFIALLFIIVGAGKFGLDALVGRSNR